MSSGSTTDTSSTTDSQTTTKRTSGRIRTERNIRWQSLVQEMRDLGYWAQPMFLDRFGLYRVMIILVNHLAYVLQRHPARVYKAALCRARRATHGQPHMAYKQARPPQDRQSETSWAHGLSVLCPKCGQELLDCGPETRDEVRRNIAARASVPHNSPQ